MQPPERDHPVKNTVYNDFSTCHECGSVIVRRTNRCIDNGHGGTPRLRIQHADGRYAWVTWAEFAAMGGAA
jgi:hypothetical protein